MAAFLAASTLVHALAIVLLVSLVRTRAPLKPIVVFPISLVSIPGSGGSPGGGTPEPGPPAATPPPSLVVEPAPPPPVPAAPVEPPKPIAKPKAAPKPPNAAPAPKATATPGSDAAPSASADGAAAGTGGGGGSGSGPGGRGSGATPGYGTNPQPLYPVVARRLRLEGTVLLRIVVAPDGSPRDVSIARSSGHEALDESAATTVRTRWRFVPASKDGRPIEDTVTVPIQFRINDDLR